MIIMLGIMGGVIVTMLLLALIFKLVIDRNTAINMISGKPKQENISLSKKYPEADLEKFRFTFLKIGLIAALGLVILAFSWTTYDRQTEIKGSLILPEDFEIEPPITRHEPPPPIPPLVDIRIIETDIIIEDKVEFETLEIDADFTLDVENFQVPDEHFIEDDAPVFFAEEMPQFPGGEKALIDYLASTPYPAMAKENWMEGTVYVKFVIDKYGKVTDVDIARGSDKIFNKAALAHIMQMPDWTPGKQRGKPVKVQFVVPIRFVLQ